jgi:sec-independent protein translocase protein TatB
MFDIGWSEMAIIMLVALIVIGPKDLPRVARNVGKWVGKGRALARDFQRQLEDMAREAELDKVKSEIEKAGRTDLKRSIERQIDPKGDLKDAFDVSKKEAGKSSTNASEAEGEPAGATEPGPFERPAPRPGANGADQAGADHDATGEPSGTAAAREKAPTH